MLCKQHLCSQVTQQINMKMQFIVELVWLVHLIVGPVLMTKHFIKDIEPKLELIFHHTKHRFVSMHRCTLEVLMLNLFNILLMKYIFDNLYRQSHSCIVMTYNSSNFNQLVTAMVNKNLHVWTRQSLIVWTQISITLHARRIC